MAIPIATKIAAQIGSMAASEDGRKKLLLLVLIPVITLIVLVSLVAYIISSPFSALAEAFQGAELGAAESIWGDFNGSATLIDGEFVYYSQYDEDWAEEPYSGGTIASHGCGPTSLAMILATFSGDAKFNPRWLAQYFTENGGVHETDGTYRSAFAHAINHIPESLELGLSIQQFTSWEDFTKAMSDVSSGKTGLGIAGVKGGVWTSGGGHFIVIRSIDEDDHVQVADPASVAKTEMNHAPETVYGAASVYWLITGPAIMGVGAAGEYDWPFHCRFSIDRPFGYRSGTYSCGYHTGQDFNANPEGSLVYSIGPGKVIYSQVSKSYGDEVRIMHPDGYVSLYAHMQNRLVSVGDTVTSDTPLGKEGETGKAYGKHLHFEIHKGSYRYPPSPKIDPLDYLASHGVSR